MTIPRSRGHLRRPIGVLVLVALVSLVAACGGDVEAEAGVRSVPVGDAAELFENQPEGLVVLDVRTPEEFAAGHLADAVLIDFYEADFRARIAELDRDAPYLLYCRSGNRSGSAAEIMEDLGFSDVTDVEGGINSWVDAGRAVVS